MLLSWSLFGHAFLSWIFMNAMMLQLFIKLSFGGIFKSSSFTFKMQILYPRISLTFLSRVIVSPPPNRLISALVVKYKQNYLVIAGDNNPISYQAIEKTAKSVLGSFNG
jgi:hypothetical protein